MWSPNLEVGFKLTGPAIENGPGILWKKKKERKMTVKHVHLLISSVCDF